MTCRKSENGWELCRIANEHLSCDNFCLKSEDIDRIEQVLQPKFGDRMKKEHVSVSYDNWSGVFIMQMPGFNTDSSDGLISEIYEFLSQNDLLVE